MKYDLETEFNYSTYFINSFLFNNNVVSNFLLVPTKESNLEIKLIFNGATIMIGRFFNLIFNYLKSNYLANLNFELEVFGHFWTLSDTFLNIFVLYLTINMR